MEVIDYLSSYIGRARRKLEAQVLQKLINNNFCEMNNLNDNQIASINSILDKGFPKDKGGPSLVDLKGKIFYKSNNLSSLLTNEDFKKYLEMFLEYVIYKNEVEYNNSDDFILYERYTKKDVFQLINSLRNDESVVGGYRPYMDLKIVPIFIAYHKDPNDKTSAYYEDTFLDEETLLWFSKSGATSLKNKEIEKVLTLSEDKDSKFELFIKKKSSTLDLTDDNTFTYFGRVKIIKYREDINKLGNPIVKFILKLENPVKGDIFTYFTSPIDL